MGSVILRPISENNSDEGLAVGLRRFTWISLFVIIISYFIDAFRYGYHYKRFWILNLRHDWFHQRVLVDKYKNIVDIWQPMTDVLYISLLFVTYISSKWYFALLLIAFTAYSYGVTKCERDIPTHDKGRYIVIARCAILFILWVYLFTWTLLSYNIRHIYYKNLDFPSNRKTYYHRFIISVIILEVIALVVQCLMMGKLFPYRFRDLYNLFCRRNQVFMDFDFP